MLFQMVFHPWFPVFLQGLRLRTHRLYTPVPLHQNCVRYGFVYCRKPDGHHLKSLSVPADLSFRIHSPEEMEDLLSIGTIGLMKAVVTFDPDKSARLASYAARCIENEVLMYLRGKKKSSKEVSLYEPIGTDREGNEIQLFDVIEMNEEDVYRRLERKEDVIRLYQQVESVLSQRERMVLKLRYGLYNEEEYTQREIAAMLGISRSYVSRIEKSAIEKLRNFFTS